MEGIAKAKNKVRGRVSKLDVLMVSAYAIAVKHGYTGTEEEFYSDLDSFDEKADATAQNALVALERSVDAANAAELAVQSAAAASRSENNANEAYAATTHLANSVSEWMLRAEEAKKEAEQSAQGAKASADNAYDSALTAGACLLNTESYMQKAQDAAAQAHVSAELAAQAEDFVRNYQPDWEQNDSAEIGYIRNRPFYSAPGLDEVSVPMEAVSTPSGTMYISPYFTEVAQYRGFYLVKDCDYLVTYDDVEYNCKAFEFTTALDVKSVAIGNPELVAMGPSGTVIPDGAGTDAPFAILGGTEFRSFDGETHYVTIAPGVVKLPNEYLDVDYINEIAGGAQPDWNQNDSAAPDYIKNRPFYEGATNEALLVETMVVVDPDMETGSFRAAVSFVEGDTYTVKWRGTKYECVAQYGNGLWGEDEAQTVDLKAPGVFEIYDYGGGVFVVLSMNGGGVFDILISHVVAEVKQIDSKYLPTETWVFTLEDGSTIEKKVVVAE